MNGHRYTTEQREFLIKHLNSTRNNGELAALFNQEFSLSIETRKITQYLQSRKIYRDNRKIVLHNHFFKPGHKVKHHKPIGSKRFNRNGWYIKTAEPNTWEPLKNVIWKDHHKRDIPSDCVIALKDKDFNNLSIDNIACITKGESCLMNRLFPKINNPELFDAKLATIRLIQHNKQLKNGHYPTTD